MFFVQWLEQVQGSKIRVHFPDFFCLFHYYQKLAVHQTDYSPTPVSTVGLSATRPICFQGIVALKGPVAPPPAQVMLEDTKGPVSPVRQHSFNSSGRTISRLWSFELCKGRYFETEVSHSCVIWESLCFEMTAFEVMESCCWHLYALIAEYTSNIILCLLLSCEFRPDRGQSQSTRGFLVLRALTLRTVPTSRKSWAWSSSA